MKNCQILVKNLNFVAGFYVFILFCLFFVLFSFCFLSMLVNSSLMRRYIPDAMIQTS